MQSAPRDGAAEVAGDMVARSVDILLRQTRAGAVALGIAGVLYGLLLVPAAGWARFLAWYGVLVGSLVARQVYFARLGQRRDRGADTLLRIATITAVTGWIPPLAVPLFIDSLTLSDVGVLTVMTLGSLSAAVAVLGVHPRAYCAYLVGTLATVYVGWLCRADRNEQVMVGVAMVVGGYMLQRAVSTYWRQLGENVDIAARNAQLVDQLRAALERQHDIQNARSRFLGAASHDLRQPVQALLFLSDIFRRSSDNTRREAIAQQIVRTGESIDNMFRQLVDFAQIDAGTMQPNVQPLQLARLVQASVSGFGEKCAAKGLHFQLQVTQDLSVRADPVILERLLRNFLDNAWKYSLRGEISLRVLQLGDHVEIHVRDEGVGMDEEDLATVWNAFQRGRSAGIAEAEGIGLGLAICRHMADLMGAELRLDSIPGRGTTATIRLPALKHAAAPDPTAFAPRQQALSGRCIVLVENDRLAREALAEWLQDAGATVISGADLRQVEQASEDHPAALHCVIADYRLAQGNGLDVIAALRLRHGPIPAVVISSEPDLKHRDLGVPCLQKPVDPDTLLDTLQRLLGLQPASPA